MKKKYSRFLEDKDKVILKRERRVIISEGVDDEEKENEEKEEEEEYWDYEDGGQPMEELDRLDQIEERRDKLVKTFAALKPENLFFKHWKKKTFLNLDKLRPNGIKEKNGYPIPDKEKELNKDILNEPELKDEKEKMEEKVPKRFDKINIRDKIIPSKKIDTINHKYSLDLNIIKNNKIGFPKMLLCSPTILPIGQDILEKEFIEKPKEFKEVKLKADYINKYPSTELKKLPILFEDYQIKLPEISISLRGEKLKKLPSKTIEVPTSNKETILEQIVPNPPIEKDVNEPFIIKDQLLPDLKDENELPKKKINKIEIRDRISPSDNIELFDPNYISRINLIENLTPKFINLYPGISLDPISGRKEPGKENKIDISTLNDKISLEQIVPNKPIKRDAYHPFILTSEKEIPSEKESLDKEVDDQIIMNKIIKYLIKTDKKKKEIKPNEKIYIIKEEGKTTEEIIYTEIVYEISKYKEYNKRMYMENKNISKDKYN